jgi:outer membrane protein assembly factor BamB
VYSDGLIVGCYKGGGVALDVDLDSKQTADSIRYAVPRSVAPYVPSPIIVEDFLFLFMDSGVVSCLELKTGKILWKERPGGPIYGSPICVGNNLYCISKDGKVIVITVSPMFQLNGIYDLGEGSFSTPAMSMDGMVFRTFSKLMLLGNSKG